MHELEKWIEIALTVADSEGMADGQIIPTWPSDVAGYYPTLTIGALREWKAAYGHDQVNYRAVATRAIGDIAKITELLGVAEEEAGRPIVELVQEFLSARTQALASGEVVGWVSECPGSSVLFFERDRAETYSAAHDGEAKPLTYADTHPPAKVPEGCMFSDSDEARDFLDSICKPEYSRYIHDGERLAGDFACHIASLLTTPTTATTPAKVPEWIDEISENLKTQNNRITQDPLFVVFQKREIVADEKFDHDRIAWGNSDGEADDEVQEKLNEIYDDLDSDFFRSDDITLTDEDGTAEWRRVALKEVDEFVTACFTEVGANDYLKANSHNLIRPYIYVTSLYRNEEMKRLREWLLTTPTTAATPDTKLVDRMCEILNGMMDGTEEKKYGLLEPWKSTYERLLERLATTPEAESFQSRVQPWLLECFGEVIADDREERNHRFLEEALELVQSLRCTAEEAHKLVHYVFSRPVGDPPQEVGGVQVTLAALCLANSMDMHQCGEAELARITQPEMVEKIREKQKRKPSMSPLPGVYPDRPAPPQEQGQ